MLIASSLTAPWKPLPRYQPLPKIPCIYAAGSGVAAVAAIFCTHRSKIVWHVRATTKQLGTHFLRGEVDLSSIRSAPGRCGSRRRRLGVFNPFVKPTHHLIQSMLGRLAGDVAMGLVRQLNIAHDSAVAL